MYHASRADMTATQTDMSKETAEKAVDLILQTPSQYVTIEFQGGEPLVNFAGGEAPIEYAKEKNREVGKYLEFTMVSNLALMDEGEAVVPARPRSADLHEHRRPRAPARQKQRKLVGSSAFEPPSTGSSASTRPTPSAASTVALPRRGAAHDDARDALPRP